MKYVVVYLNEVAFPAEASVHDSITDCEDVIDKLMKARGQKEAGRSFDKDGFWTRLSCESGQSYMIMSTGHKLV